MTSVWRREVSLLQTVSKGEGEGEGIASDTKYRVMTCMCKLAYIYITNCIQKNDGVTTVLQYSNTCM